LPAAGRLDAAFLYAEACLLQAGLLWLFAAQAIQKQKPGVSAGLLVA